MTTTVKEIVEKLIMSTPTDDIEVDTIENQFPEFDRVDIVSAMKILESEKVGVLIVGRRNKKTRFRRGYMRLPTGINKCSLEQLRNCVSVLNRGTEFPLDSTGGSQQNATEFFVGNKNHAIEALKTLESEGLGVFLIGRRGSFSRFVVGVCRDDLINKTKTTLVKIPKQSYNVIDIHSNVQEQIQEENLVQEHVNVKSIEEDSNSRYTIISGIMFKSDLEDDDGFSSVDEALEQSGYSNVDLNKLHNALNENGFSKLEDFKNVVNV